MPAAAARLLPPVAALDLRPRVETAAYDRSSPVVSPKLSRLIELVSELRAEGYRALVFSQFTPRLALVREARDQAAIPALYLDGDTPAALRRPGSWCFKPARPKCS